MELDEKLKILADAAKYDVSCSSSGSKEEIRIAGRGMRVMPASVTAGRRMAGAFPC